MENEALKDRVTICCTIEEKDSREKKQFDHSFCAAIPVNAEINREKRNVSYIFAFKTVKVCKNVGKCQYLKYLCLIYQKC